MSEQRCGFCEAEATGGCVRCRVAACAQHVRATGALCPDCTDEFRQHRSARWLTKLFVIPPFSLFAAFVAGFVSFPLGGIGVAFAVAVGAGAVTGVATGRWVDREARQAFVRDPARRLPAARARLR
jgi:hypothetical protein